jgi:hypothetical protein
MSIPTRFLASCLGALVVLPVGQARAQVAPLPPDEQVRVNKAIDKGVRFLKESRTPAGTWEDPQGVYPTGYTALPALVLLECGVAPTDAAIVRPVTFVRRHAAGLDRTYELALAILFLDRLGDPKDKETIKSCAVRLLAGQAPSGGWGYRCPVVSAKNQKEILDLLKQCEAVGGGDPLPKNVQVPQRFRQLAVFREPSEVPDSDPLGHNFDANTPTTDNSNTQFAILALWRAQKYDIPVARTLTRAVRRFHGSQNADGSWGYWHRKGGDFERPSMDCVGLLALAIGYGVDRPPGDKAPANKNVNDVQVINGFAALSRYIGEGALLPPGINYYYLWSVERVGVLYGLRTIANREWYRWGAKIIVGNQGEKGEFLGGMYRGANPLIDTCFALLFLKQVNLASDLTAKLPFQARQLDASIAKQAALLPAAKVGASPGSVSPGSTLADPKDKPAKP